jgi:hypothetical protein
MMYDATNPSDIFPNARAVSITCLDDRIWILHIAAKKVRPSQLDVEIALDGLKQKYKLYSGDTQVNTDVTRSVFAAGNVEIALDAEQKRDFYMIRYTVHKERFGELSDSDRKAVNDDIESIKKQKSAL